MTTTPRIAVLGANGQLGQDLLRLGAARGSDVFGVSRPMIDALDPAVNDATLKALSFDVAVNCVAATRVDDCERDPLPAVEANAHFAEQLARACQRNKARLVQVSTDYVFGGQVARTPLAETEARAPLNVYGATKALGEDLARCESDDVLVVRVASLFGVAGASGKGGNFVETMIRLGRERGLLKVVADQYMSPTSSHDAAEAILDLVAGAAPTGVYHLVNSGAATWFEFARRIIERAGVAAEVQPITTQDFPTPARRPGYSVLSNALIQSTLDRNLPHWTDGLDRYLMAKGYR